MDVDILEKAFNESKQAACDILNKCQAARTAFAYLKEVENNIEHFKQFGRFKENDQIRPIKQERMSEKPPPKILSAKEAVPTEHVHVQTVKQEMPPPTEPLKRTRKVKQNEAPRITRSKIKKEIEKPERITRSRKNTLSEPVGRDSDVILQKQEIVTITLTENEGDVNKNVETKRNESQDGHDKPTNNQIEETAMLQRPSKRNTRANAIANETISKTDEYQKRLRSPSTEDDKKKAKSKQTKTKRLKSLEVFDKESSIYEDAISNNEALNRVDTKSVYDADAHRHSKKGCQVNDATFALDKGVMDGTVILEEITATSETVVSKKPTEKSGAFLNETVTLEKPKIVKGKPMIDNEILCSPNINNCNNHDDLMTDDESQDEPTPIITRNKKNITKPIFSAFAKSPVKQRIEAFEKLGAGTTSEVKETRTISKIARKQREADKQGDISHLKNIKGTNQKTTLTPLHDRNKSKLGTSAILNNDSLIPKSASALKASQQEFKLKELKRKEKEAEAIRKREALLQAQTEERRQKREEKQLKAQQIREARGLEKQKSLVNTEKAKEEKLKQILAEKQEKLARQREEAEKRRYLAAKKAAEEKRKEKCRVKAIEEDYPHDRTAKFLEQRMKEDEMKKRAKPKYLTMKAPLLPSPDCYDSDDERGKEPHQKPAWNEWTNLYPVLMNVSYLDNKMINTFFCCQATTPDLQDIFENIDPKKLKRTSSAIWKRPPRFTLMPLPALESSIVE